MNAAVDDIESAFRSGDIERLSDVASALRSQSDPNASSRAFQLLGDLYRRGRQFAKAEEAYGQSDAARPSGNAAAVYGMLECFKARKQAEKFAETLPRYLDIANDNENLMSRLALAAAELGDAKNARALLKRIDIENRGSKEPRTWFRCSKASLLLGRKKLAKDYASRAEELAEGDVDLLLEIATISYNLEEYWELRYNSSQGERAPVPVSSQSDSRYSERKDRDVEYLESVFRKIFGEKRFGAAVDCGCGSGRLTGFLSSRSDHLTSYDISPTAVEFARKNNAGLENVEFKSGNLSKTRLKKGHFDLVFDFTAVQHVSNRAIWKRVLRNYANGCRSGGHVFLVEVVGDGQKKDVLHVSNATPEDYVDAMEGMGLKNIFKEVTPWNEICLIFEKPS